jgi:methyl-accepting chemotaxis protein
LPWSDDARPEILFALHVGHGPSRRHAALKLVADAASQYRTATRAAAAIDVVGDLLTIPEKLTAERLPITNALTSGDMMTEKDLTTMRAARRAAGQRMELSAGISAGAEQMASRAGDAGKSFAVVASEVKALANQTAQATEEISTQIQSIQAATTEAVGAIQAIGGTINEIHEISNAIAAAVDQQGSATREISGSVQQAASGTHEVDSNISGVAQASSEIGSAASKLLEAATGLSSQSERLKFEVASFLASVRAA